MFKKITIVLAIVLTIFSLSRFFKNYIYPKEGEMFKLSKPLKKVQTLNNKKVKSKTNNPKEFLIHYCEKLEKLENCCYICYTKDETISLDTTYKITSIDSKKVEYKNFYGMRLKKLK